MEYPKRKKEKEKKLYLRKGDGAPLSSSTDKPYYKPKNSLCTWNKFSNKITLNTPQRLWDNRIHHGMKSMMLISLRTISQAKNWTFLEILNFQGEVNRKENDLAGHSNGKNLHENTCAWLCFFLGKKREDIPIGWGNHLRRLFPL